MRLDVAAFIPDQLKIRIKLPLRNLKKLSGLVKTKKSIMA
jgi:hypothetical protein